MKIILILLSLSLVFFATADQNPDCQGLSCLSKGEISDFFASLSEEQIEYLIQFHILGQELGLTYNLTTQEKCKGSGCLSEEQIEFLQSLYLYRLCSDFKKVQAKEEKSPQVLKKETTRSLTPKRSLRGRF